MIVDCLPILPYRIRYIKKLCIVSVQLHHKGVAERLYGFREGVSLRQRPLHSVHVRESLFIGALRRLITTRAPIYRRTALNELRAVINIGDSPGEYPILDLNRPFSTTNVMGGKVGTKWRKYI